MVTAVDRTSSGFRGKASGSRRDSDGTAGEVRGGEPDDGARDAAELRRLRSSQSAGVSLTSFVQQRPSCPVIRTPHSGQSVS